MKHELDALLGQPIIVRYVVAWSLGTDGRRESRRKRDGALEDHRALNICDWKSLAGNKLEVEGGQGRTACIVSQNK